MKIMNHFKMMLAVLATSAFFVSVGSAQDDWRAKVQEAIQNSQSEDFEKAVELLREVEKENGIDPFIAFHLGYNLHASGNLDEAIKYHKTAIDSDNKEIKVLALYNLACAHSLKDEKDDAFKYLKKAIGTGYQRSDQIAHAKQDPDFKNIKTDPRWKDMIAMMENGGKMPEKKAGNKLVGTWAMESGMKSGAKIEDSHLSEVKITDKTFTMPSQGGQPFVMSYKIDMDAKPMAIDFTIDSGPMAVGAKAKGIVKMGDGGMMKLCYDPQGGDRPDTFTSTDENGYFTFKLKKSMEKTEAKETKTLAAKMQGKWKCIKGMRAGEAVAEERMASVITIDEKAIRIPVGEDAAFVMSYKLDESKTPATIDMKVEEGPAPEGSAAIGIVKMEGGKFYLCYDSMGANRPEKFKAEDQGVFYFEMKKVDE